MHPERPRPGLYRVPVRRLLRDTARKWQKDNILRLSAALAYYAIFAVAPLLVVVLSLAGLVFGDAAVRGQLDEELQGLMGARAAETVQDMVVGAMQPKQSAIATALGIGLLVLAGTSLFAELQHSLNVIWGAERQSDSGALLREGIVAWLRTRLLSLGMMLVILFLLLASLVFTSAVSFLSSRIDSLSAIPVPLWGWLGFAISVAGEIVLFALLYKIMPDVRVPWHHVWWGATVTTVLFEAGKWALGWYLSSGLVASGYGAAGSIVLLLLWVYYTSIIILTGAELTQVRSRMCGEAGK